MSTVSNEFLTLLEKTFTEQLEEEINRCADEAAEQARIRVKKRLGELTVGLFSEYTAFRRGQELVITVNIKE
jgi:hypothetical protein